MPSGLSLPAPLAEVPAAAVAPFPAPVEVGPVEAAGWGVAVPAGAGELVPEGAAVGGSAAGALEKLRDSASPKRVPLHPARPGSNNSARRQAPRRRAEGLGRDAAGGGGLLNCPRV